VTGKIKPKRNETCLGYESVMVCPC